MSAVPVAKQSNPRATPGRVTSGILGAEKIDDLFTLGRAEGRLRVERLPAGFRDRGVLDEVGAGESESQGGGEQGGSQGGSEVGVGEEDEVSGDAEDGKGAGEGPEEGAEI